jgi:hypothetical protein
MRVARDCGQTDECQAVRVLNHIRISRQDGPRFAPLFVTALVSIDPATLEHGCLEIANCPRQTGLIGRE